MIYYIDITSEIHLGHIVFNINTNDPNFIIKDMGNFLSNLLIEEKEKEAEIIENLLIELSDEDKKNNLKINYLKIKLYDLFNSIEIKQKYINQNMTDIVLYEISRDIYKYWKTHLKKNPFFYYDDIQVKYYEN